MKIIIPIIDNNRSKDNIAQGFHNAGYVCIYDCSSNTYEWLTINELAPNAGNLSLELKRRGIFTVISGYMSLMALGLFTESGLKVYKAESDSVQENIKLFLENKLPPLTTQSILGMSACIGSCNSCGSSCN